MLKRCARQYVCEGIRSERKQRVKLSQVEHLWRASYQHETRCCSAREFMPFGQLDRATRTRTLYRHTKKTRWEDQHHDHAPGFQRRYELLQGTQPPEDDRKRAASPIENHKLSLVSQSLWNCNSEQGNKLSNNGGKHTQTTNHTDLQVERSDEGKPPLA
jgi:hypothetical protein